MRCRECNGHGADPLSDNVNFLPCRSCTGTGRVISEADLKLKGWLEGQGYYNVRVLADGVIANIHYIFTDSVIIGANYGGFERRICYPRGSGLAEKMCLGMASVDDIPIPGYTALK